MLVAYLVFALVSQALLLAFFTAHLARWGSERLLGRAVYGMGGVAIALAAWLILGGADPYLIPPLGFYAVWAAFGTWIDLVRPTPWREPPRWPILIPYAALLITGLLWLWVPLWYISWPAWLAFGILYAAHTTLNIASHVVARRRGAHV